MDQQSILRTSRLLLRPLTLSDASTVQELAGDCRIAQMTENIPHPYPDGVAEEWIRSLQPKWEARTQASFAVCLADHDALIGCCGLRIVPSHRRASLGYWIGTNFWNKGYCTEAAEAVCEFAFETLKVHRIEAQHLAKNPASGAVMRKLGMTHEATLTDYVIKQGRFEDMEQYSRLMPGQSSSH